MARPPFPTALDFLQVYPGGYHAGTDEVNLRDDYYPSTAFVRQDTFTMPGSSTKIYGAWSVDDGDMTIAKENREPRVFATKGKLILDFTGISLILRVELNSGWGKGQIYIDGAKPSTIAGLTTAVDTIDCNADNYADVNGAQYRDFLVVDGLADGPHRLELYANNAADGFVVVSAAKCRKYQLKPNIIAGWHAGVATRLNDGALTLHNLGNLAVMDVSLSIPPSLVARDGSAFPASIPVGRMAPGQRYTLSYAVDGTTQPDDATIQVGLTARYPDPAGDTQMVLTTDYTVDTNNLTFSSGWSKDQDTLDGAWRAFSNGSGKTATFKLDQTSFRITLLKDSGWGQADVLIGTTVYATLDCNDDIGGGFAQDVTVGNLPAGSKTITIKSKNTSAKPFVFTKVSFDAQTSFATVNEILPMTFKFSHVPPYPAPGVRLQNGLITWDAVDKTKVDMTLPRTNDGVVAARQYTRFPTYCVYYSAGKDDVLNKYDLLVIEPSAVSRKQVAAWQAQGIKVLGYVTFGEEHAELTDIYDAESPVRPAIDDGQGTGGYASYFCKGGNLFGEASECNHDRQRVEGVKACSVGNPKYFTGTGRCSPVCSNDYRLGGVDQSTGKACKAGYTSANYWQRDAMAACQNSDCPKYTPRNKGCSQWAEADVRWGQDFAMDDSYPDQNGIWDSSFINPLAPRWFDKLKTQYLPTVMDAPIEYSESHAIAAHVTASDGKSVFVFRTDHWPIDDAERLLVSNDSGFVYTANVDYSYDKDTGAFIMDPNAGVDSGAQPALVAGQTLHIIYTRKGLNCDGLFMDTVDTVDVYPSQAFQSAFADMINRLKALWPSKAFCSNRGFTILDAIIKSCSYVMFESFLVDYDWATGAYAKIADPESVAYNDAIKEQLRALRRSHRFDVLALNYCDNGPAGDELRNYIADTCYKEGYISWSSTIMLDDPLPNKPVSVNPGGAIRSNVWYLLKQVKA
ncbi:hypothetical protein N5B55_05200 [Ralstonia pickettii]|uniref:hypothetical protein n=1 Tax=Ralstonia pickettii TaxID=329 RepID=UPI0027149A17|nr:hypothetical protein [Ralstonia pickettii]WKZ86352.1 hypothetical protein N5B55_05200 [Ralstonia pickettii]